MKILVAGATGYLGQHILRHLIDTGLDFRALARSVEKLDGLQLADTQIFIANATDADSLAGCCNDIDVVISCLGITRQQDGLSYMDVDYQANLNLLNEAKAGTVRKFIYVSVLNGPKLQSLKICAAKEQFAVALQKSGLEYTIIRPNGFFSDLDALFQMARKGRMYLFGDGNLQSNPVHGQDLARFCVDAIEKDDTDLDIGGPDTFSQNDIAHLAFAAAKQPPKITFIPDIVRNVGVKILGLLMDDKRFGPIEFFTTVMAMDMIAPEYGNIRLQSYFEKLAEADPQ